MENQEILVKTIEGLGKRVGDLIVENQFLQVQLEALNAQLQAMQQALQEQHVEQVQGEVVEE